MIAVTLPEELMEKLDYVSKKTEKSRSFLIRESLERFIDWIGPYISIHFLSLNP